MTASAAVRTIADTAFRVLDDLGVLAALDRTRGNRVTTLMYHGILPTKTSSIGSPALDKDSFARQVRYLRRKFQLLHPAERGEGEGGDSSRRRRVLLTFDDGFGNNGTVAMPILDELQAPAIFFVTTRHMKPGRYLWFTHALALFMLHPARRIELLERTWELGSPAQRKSQFENFVTASRSVSSSGIYSSLAQYPVESFVPPRVIEDEMRGLTPEELRAASGNSLFEIGAHTRDHPVLTTCADDDLDAQVAWGRDDIADICGGAPVSFAYPEGQYDGRVAESVKRAGFRRAFAAGPVTTPAGAYAIPRAGVYSGGLGALAAKSYGLMRG